MTRDELLLLVEAILGSSKNSVVTPLLERLREALPHSAISDLIFWNPVNLTSEQIVDEALRREEEYARHNDPKS